MQKILSLLIVFSLISSNFALITPVFAQFPSPGMGDPGMGPGPGMGDPGMGDPGMGPGPGISFPTITGESI